MAHQVSIEIPSTRTVLHKDIKFEVRGSTGKIGTLLISKGNIEWLASPKSIKKRRLSWRQFAAVMALEGKPARAARKKKTSRTRA